VVRKEMGLSYWNETGFFSAFSRSPPPSPSRKSTFFRGPNPPIVAPFYLLGLWRSGGAVPYLGGILTPCLQKDFLV